MKQINVEIADAPYPVFIGNGLRAEIGDFVRNRLGPGTHIAVVTNPTVGAHYADEVLSSLGEAGFEAAVAEVQDGEQYKTLDTVRGLYARFLEIGLDRKGLVLALGGGVVGDMAGFAAATYLRGVPFVQMPTSLLAMIDASVGGKTGVDLPEGKNLVGAFKQPEMVLIDPEVLTTLDQEELASGMAEVIKHGIIGDPALFESLERAVPMSFVDLIDSAVRVKAAVVSRDPLEEGERALLNLGHTFAHAFELVSNYSLKHGVAVGVGLVAASEMAAVLGECNPVLVTRIEKTLEMQRLPARLDGYPVQRVLDAMKHDKKRANKRLRFVIPEALGRCRVLEDAPDDVVKRAVASVLAN